MNWHQAPFVRLLLPLIAGLLGAYYLPNAALAAGMGILFLVLMPVLFFWAWRPRLALPILRAGSGLLFAAIFALGYSLLYWQDPRQQATHIQNITDLEQKYSFVARVQSVPQLKNTTLQVDLQMLQIKDSKGQWQPLSGKVNASIQLDSLSANLAYGDGLLLQSNLRPIGPAENPHGFDVASYQRIKGIFHQTYIPSGRWQALPAMNGGHPLWKRMLAWQKQLSQIFEQHLAAAPNEMAVASALILGSRSQFSADLRNAYADTGATHVLSVSGLHVGLVAGLLGWILGRLRPKKRGKKWKYLETALLFFAIWFYALLTGASPSVLRATVMFSFLIIGQAIGRKTSIYNTLAASAFFLLCLQPLVLWDIGFQLSYLALAGIVYLHPMIYRRWFIANKLGDWAWNLTAVALAAQIATLPISLYYFHQFPTYFWLSGLAVIPLSTIVLYVGILLLCFGAIPGLGWLLGLILYWALALMNAAIFAIQQLPFSVIEGFWLESWEMWLWYLVIAGAILAIVYQKPRWRLTTAVLLLFLAGHNLYQISKAAQQRQIVVYKVYKGSSIDFVQGQRVLTLADSMHNALAKLDWLHQNHLYALRVRQQEAVATLHRDSVATDMLYMSRLGIGRFADKTFAILPPELLSPPFAANQPMAVDYLFLRGNPKIKNLSDLEQAFDFKYLVFDASNAPYRLAAWRQQCEAEGIPFIDGSEVGKTIDLNTRQKKD